MIVLAGPGTVSGMGVGVALAENVIRRGHAACLHWLRMPPRRGCWRMSSLVMWSGSVMGEGNDEVRAALCTGANAPVGIPSCPRVPGCSRCDQESQQEQVISWLAVCGRAPGVPHTSFAGSGQIYPATAA